VVAALSVSGPASRLTGRVIPDAGARCLRVAAALSAVLGYETAGLPEISRMPPDNRTQKEGAP
jgi:hypothetical protein